MDSYIILKSGVMAMALLGAFSCFFIRLGRLYSLMKAVSGTTETVANQKLERIKVLFTDVLGQSNVRRKPLIGAAHSLIFFGFLAVQPHSLGLMVQGVCPAFEPAHLLPRLYGGYLFTADILAVLVLAGFGYALYRRLLVRPRYLTLGRDANLIILFTCVIIVTFHLLNALTLLMPAAESYNYARVWPVSRQLVPLLGLERLSPVQLRLAYETCYWIHIGTILGFLIYIPGSKHLHLLAAIPNVFLKRLDREKAIAKTDIENEEAETFGLGKVSELSWKDVLNLYACTECGRCEEQCPASQTGKPLSPKALVHDFKVDLLNQADAVRSRSFARVVPIVRPGSPSPAMCSGPAPPAEPARISAR